ncbi:TonB-dependent receptor [Colwellia sp. RE-S-Sl-9]
MTFIKKRLATGISLALLTTVHYAHAEEVSSEESATARIEKITVTVRKKEEFLQDSPLSISAFSASDIADSGLSDARDIADLTPGLQISGDFGRNSERPVIRGISNLRPETPQPVGLFIDGVFIRTGIISSILDNVQRVEVLKGPQSALYGRSTYGGVINYITKKPTNELSGNLTGTVGQHGHQDINGNISGSLSENIKGSFGGRIYNYDGEYENKSGKTAGARNIGEESTTALHGSLNILASDELALNIRGYYSKDEDGQFAGYLFDSTHNNSVAGGGTECSNVLRSYFCGEVSVPDFTNIATSINKGENTTTFFGGMPAQWDFRAGLDREVKRITGDATYAISNTFYAQWLFGYTTEETEVVSNQSYSDAFVSNPFGSFPADWSSQNISERDYFSHELRFYGNITDNLSVLGGVFFYNEQLETIDRELTAPDLEFNGSTENEEIKLFGLAEYKLTDDFSLTAEIGIYKEDVNTLTATAGPDGEKLTETFDGADFRLTASYHVNDNMFLYGNIARGHKAGGFNTEIDKNNPDEAPLLSFDEEVVIQYEIGMKYSFEKGLFNLALYTLDLSDQQLSQVVILREGQPDQVQVTVVQNIGESEIKGVEASFSYYLTQNLTLSASYTLADTEITAGTDTEQGKTLGDESLVGFEIPRVSKNTGVVSAAYNAPISDSWNFKAKLDGIYASSRYAQVHNLQETGDSFKVNLRAGVENDSYEVTLWAKNLLDDDTAGNIFRYVDPGDFRFFSRAHMVFLPRGRQVGLTAKVKF